MIVNAASIAQGAMRICRFFLEPPVYKVKDNFHSGNYSRQRRQKLLVASLSVTRGTKYREQSCNDVKSHSPSHALLCSGKQGKRSIKLATVVTQTLHFNSSWVNRQLGRGQGRW